MKYLLICIYSLLVVTAAAGQEGFFGVGIGITDNSKVATTVHLGYQVRHVGIEGGCLLEYSGNSSVYLSSLANLAISDRWTLSPKLGMSLSLPEKVVSLLSGLEANYRNNRGVLIFLNCYINSTVSITFGFKGLLSNVN